MAAPVLITKRLRLRAWKDADLEPFAALNADPRVMEFYVQTLDRAKSDAFAHRARAELSERGFGLWAVEAAGVAPFIGYVGLAEVVFEAPFKYEIEIGWRLAHQHWGNGYATEAASAAIDYAFSTIGLRSIVSFTAAGNLRSRRVMERLGMQRRANEDFEHPNVPESHPLRQHVLYQLHNSQWGNRRSA